MEPQPNEGGGRTRSATELILWTALIRLWLARFWSRSTSHLRPTLDHALSTYTDAEITVLHVTDPREWTDMEGVGGAYFSEELLKQAQDSAEELMAEAEAVAEENGEAIATATETGQPAEVIVDCAEENDFDHIVLGSHGRSGLDSSCSGVSPKRWPNAHTSP